MNVVPSSKLYHASVSVLVLVVSSDWTFLG